MWAVPVVVLHEDVCLLKSRYLLISLILPAYAPGTIMSVFLTLLRTL